MTAKTVFMFSGQGSQYFQMGAPLYRQDETFRRSMDRMDTLVRELTGCSVVATLYGSHSKAAPFDVLTLTSPAIFMVEVALAETLMAAGVMPDLTLGASLGSYAASVIAGCIGVEAGLQMVVRQAQVFEDACEQGGMIAILADPGIAEAPILSVNAVVAGINYASHFVLSARSRHLPGIETYLQGAGHPFQRLPIKYPFHSPWIEPARPALSAASAALLRPRPARMPIVCCATTACITELSADHFWHVARDPIQFQRSILALEAQGAYRYVDLGPSSSLATFLKYLLPPTSPSKHYPVMTAYGRDVACLETVMKALGRPGS